MRGWAARPWECSSLAWGLRLLPPQRPDNCAGIHKQTPGVVKLQRLRWQLVGFLGFRCQLKKFACCGKTAPKRPPPPPAPALPGVRRCKATTYARRVLVRLFLASLGTLLLPG